MFEWSSLISTSISAVVGIYAPTTYILQTAVNNNDIVIYIDNNFNLFNEHRNNLCRYPFHYYQIKMIIKKKL